jgi:hypothetical protein
MKADQELFIASDRVGELVQRFESAMPEGLIDRVTDICDAMHKSWSGSNLGYHASVYFQGFKPAPPGANFSPEWGFVDAFHSNPTDSRFQQFDPSTVKDYMLREAGSPDLGPVRSAFQSLANDLPVLKRDIISILSSQVENRSDDFLKEAMGEIRKVEVISTGDVAKAIMPSGQFMSRDSLAVTQGRRLAPHQEIWAEMGAYSASLTAARELMTLARQAGAHIARQTVSTRSDAAASKTVFIGHGRSPIWRELKDFLRDTLQLEVEEFGRVPTAGISTAARLYEMLDSCGFAFLVMTGEDETADGERIARLNVVHEVGLFQGKLGPSKAIVMLEDGCSEFSNIQGLGQLRFPLGRISAVFEDVRQVLRREGLLSG